MTKDIKMTGSRLGSSGDNGSSTKSNVKVVIRIRPENTTEKEGPYNVILRDMNEHVLAFDPKEECQSPVRGRARQPRDIRKRRNKDLNFAFDYVFGPCSTNTEMFEQTTKGILDGLLEGYNCSVFAYGATGAGKTHTMLGSETEPGVMYHTMLELYDRIANMKDEKTCDIAVSYLEVYNEQISDLLLPRGSLPIREDSKNSVIISGLSLHKPKNAKELLYMLQFGNKNRTQHPTDANSESSRSHAVFQVFVRQKDRTANISAEVKVAKLCLVDLAGSERATVSRNQGARLREGANINRSLLALGNVINALAENRNKRHIPYRDSKLTRLLKDSLGGNCRTVMIAAVSPSSMSYEDTYNTLKYADRAKHIKADLKKNIVSVDFHVSRYGQIVEDLRKEIRELKSRLQMYDEGKMKSSKRQSSVNEEHRLKTILANVFESRQEIRREQLRLECVQRELQWRLGRKERCLQRLRIISGDQKSEISERVERGIRTLQSKLESVVKKKEYAASKLASNQDWLNRVQSEMNMASGEGHVTEVLSISARMHHLEVDVNDTRQHAKHLQKLVKSQDRECSATDRLVLSLLQLVRKQHFILKGHHLDTTDLIDEFENVCNMVDGRELSWEDENDDGSGPSINDITSLPLLNSVPCRGQSIALKSESEKTVNDGGTQRLGDHSYASEATEVETETNQSVNAGHTPACKKFSTLHSSVSSVSSNKELSQTVDRTKPLVPVNDTFSKPSSLSSSNELNSMLTLDVPSVSNVPEVDKSPVTKEKESTCPIPHLSKTFLPKVEYEITCLSPLARTSVAKETSNFMDLKSPYRRTSCKPHSPDPVPGHCPSPVPVPAAVDAYLSAQYASECQTPVSKTVETSVSTEATALTSQVPASRSLKGSSTITKSLPNLHGSSTVTKSLPNLHGSSTVTKGNPNVDDKENNETSHLEKKSNVARSITFGNVAATPERTEVKSYAEAVKTPSPVRLPFKALENTTPVSSPVLRKPSEEARETAKILKQYGLSSLAMAERSAPCSLNSKPSYMRSTKAVIQRSRQLFGRITKKGEGTVTAPARRVALEEPDMPRQKPLYRMRSKSVSNLSNRPSGRWQY